MTHPSGEPSYEIRKLYASAPPSPASVPEVDKAIVSKLAKRTCEANADAARFTIALQTLRASLDPDDWMGPITMHSYIDTVLAGGSPLQHLTPSPAQAVDASEIYKRGWVACAGWAKRPDLIADIDSPAYANERAARLATPQPEPAWSPAYTRGPARQSAPVAAVPAMVPLHSDAIGELAEKYAYRDFTNDYPQTIDDLVRDVEAHHGIGLTVGGSKAGGDK